MAMLSQLLHHPELKLKPIWSPHANVMLRWSAVSELANPAPFLEGGEVLMTTSAGQPSSPSAWRSYVSRLKAAGVAAIAFGVGEQYATMPPDLIDAAHEYDMNLVEVPKAERFVRISRVLAQILEDEKNDSARRLQQAQKALIAATSKIEPAKALMRAISQVIDGPVVLFSDGAIQMQHGLSGLESLPAAVQEKSQSEQDRAWSIIESDYSAVGIRVGEEYFVVAVGRTLMGWQRSALSDFVILLESTLANERQRRKGRFDLYRHALERLSDGDAAAAEVVLTVLNPDYHLPRKLVALAVGVSRHGFVDLAEDLIVRLRSPLPVKYMGDGEGHILVPASAVPLVSSVVAQAGVRAGFGAVTDPAQSRVAIDTARISLDRANDQRKVVHWNEISGSGLVGLLGSDRIRAWAEDFLSPLAHRPELVQTLAVFISVNGNRRAMAEELGVHRNTVTARIAQIERALGRNLDEPSARAEAWIALRERAGFDAPIA